VKHGEFSVDSANRLRFAPDEPGPWRRRVSASGRITFEGDWRLDDNHDLVFAVSKDNAGAAAGKLTMKGTLLAAETDALVFEVASLNQDGLLHVQLLKIAGTWFADSSNRLCFSVRHSKESLALKADWQLNKDQHIVYRYEKFDRLRKDTIVESLTFEGHWQLGDSRVLTYSLGSSDVSTFEFRAQIETPTIYPKQGVIKYRLGLGLRQLRRRREKILCLYGAWKISRALRVTFSMDYGQGIIRTYEFASDMIFSRRDAITFVLKNGRGQGVGIQVIFTHRFIKQLGGEIFLRLEARRDRLGAYAGVQIPW
jgi:hypothetical protein